MKKLGSRSARYLAAMKSEGGRQAAWALLDKSEKAEARRLVSDWAYPVDLAIQRAYIWGGDKNPCNYRARRHAW